MKLLADSPISTSFSGYRSTKGRNLATLRSKALVEATDLRTSSNENSEPSIVLFSRITKLHAHRVICSSFSAGRTSMVFKHQSKLSSWNSYDKIMSQLATGSQHNLDPLLKRIPMEVKAYPARTSTRKLLQHSVPQLLRRSTEF